MNEAEVLEMINLHASNAIAGYVIFTTFTFGYLTVAYFVGSKLSLPQVIIVSVLYVTSAVIFTLVALVHLESLEALVVEYPNFIRSIWWTFPWSKVGVLMNAGGMLASAYFMIDVRRRINGGQN